MAEPCPTTAALVPAAFQFTLLRLFWAVALLSASFAVWPPLTALHVVVAGMLAAVLWGGALGMLFQGFRGAFNGMVLTVLGMAVVILAVPAVSGLAMLFSSKF